MVSPATLTSRRLNLHFIQDAEIKCWAFCIFAHCNKTTVYSVITVAVKRNGGQESKHLFQQHVAPFRGNLKRLVLLNETEIQRREEVRFELKRILVPYRRLSPTNAHLVHSFESCSVRRNRSARVNAHTYAHTMEHRKIHLCNQRSVSVFV